MAVSARNTEKRRRCIVAQRPFEIIPVFPAMVHVAGAYPGIRRGDGEQEVSMRPYDPAAGDDVRKMRFVMPNDGEAIEPEPMVPVTIADQQLSVAVVIDSTPTLGSLGAGGSWME
jgi:hypothetical protein